MRRTKYIRSCFTKLLLEVLLSPLSTNMNVILIDIMNLKRHGKFYLMQNTRDCLECHLVPCTIFVHKERNRLEYLD